jgi:hypothetical protein
MNVRLAAVLAGLLVLLGVAFFVSESRGGGTASATPTPKPGEEDLQLYSFSADTLKRLEVARGDQIVIVEKLEPGKWQLALSSEPADASRMSTAALRLSTLRATRKVADGGDLAPYGLATPSMKIVFTQDEAVHTLLVGNKTPNELSYYVKKAESPAVYTVSSATLGDFERMLSEPPKAPPTPTPGEIPSPEETPTPPPVATPEAPTPTVAPAPSPTSPLPAPVLPTPGPTTTPTG